MKKCLASVLSFLFAITASFMLVACSNDNTHAHSLPAGASYTVADDNHSYVCSCGETITEPHDFGENDICIVCGYEKEGTQPPAHEHSLPEGAEYMQSETGHSYVCSCGETVTEPHVYDESNVCTVCGYTIAVSQGLAFSESSEGYTLDGMGTFNGTELNIPYYYEGKPVTQIAEKAFYQNDTITAVIIPDSVESIGASAFEECSAIKSVTLGSGLSAFKNNIFKDCSALETVNIAEGCTTLGNHIQSSSNPGEYMFRNCKSLKSITLPDSLRSVGNYVFWNCTSLAEINGGNNLGIVGKDIVGNTAYAEEQSNWDGGILYVGSAAVNAEDTVEEVTFREGTIGLARCLFWQNQSIKSVTMPEGVRYMGYYAFSECPSLEELYLPVSLKYIYYYAFEDTDAELSVYYAGTLADWCEINFYDSPIGYTLYMNNEPLTDLIFPYTVTGIPDNCFYGLKNQFRSIVIPSSVTTIGDRAFYCVKADEVSVAAAKSIGESAFYWSEIGTISVSGTVENIGEKAFYYSTIGKFAIEDAEGSTDIEKNALLFKSVDELYLGSSVHSFYTIYATTTSGADGTVRMYRRLPTSVGNLQVSEDNEVYESEGNCLIDKQSKTLLYAFESSQIPSDTGITKIGFGAFSGIENIQSVTIPSTVTKIADYAFYDCSGLQSVIFNEGLTSIGKRAFQNTALTEVTFPDSLVLIDCYAFYKLNLTSATFTDTVGWYAGWRNSPGNIVPSLAIDVIESWEFYLTGGGNWSYGLLVKPDEYTGNDIDRMFL